MKARKMKTRHSNDGGPFASNLSDDQQTDMWSLITRLTEKNVTSEELKAAIQHKLCEFGVLDTRLLSEISYEGGCHSISCLDQDLTNDVGFHHGPCGGSDGFIPPEESYECQPAQ